jgi:ribulose-5-phosphate 4-epimerase/fuculose-1-phosphate aldolase
MMFVGIAICAPCRSDIMTVHPTPSSCKTHHVDSNGYPVYQRRFQWVLPFHQPGLAPVGDSNGSYHITTDGVLAYTAKFDRTFGYYEGFAAVEKEQNWFHIDVHGKRVYQRDWDWCGNFQDGFCVVRLNNRMFHIRPDGTTTNENGWTYAGDFRENSAVVRDDSGLCGHIDTNGNFFYNQRFIELGVFHKSFAIAKDASGWHHIDRKGNSLYPFRFENLEPFYNGIAKAVTTSGVDVLIDESGNISPLLGQLMLRNRELISFPLPTLDGNVIEKEKQLREQMTFIARHMYKMGYNFTIDGNISHRLSDDKIIVSPTGQHLGFICSEDFVVMDREGNLIDGVRKPTSEWRLHSRIYDIRPDVECVIHAHPPSAIAASVANVDLTKVFAHYSPIPTTDFALNCTEETSKALEPYIRSQNWAILKRHGVVTWADSLFNTFLRLEGLEQCARIVMKANAIGDIQPIPDGDVQQLFKMWGLDFDSYGDGERVK